MTLNGEIVATVGVGDTETVEVPAGESTFAVAPWSQPTSATLKLVAKAGETVELLVTPRASTAENFILAADDDGQASDNGGAFDIKMTPRG